MKIIPGSKKGGVVTNTIMGVGSLIIGVIIVLVITVTLLNADLFEDARVATAAFNISTPSEVNESGINFGNHTLSGSICSAITVMHQNGTLIGPTNYTVTSSSCLIQQVSTGGGSFNETIWVINSTTTFDGEAESAALNLQSNFTKGIRNVSEKIPTILLIVAVVFLFGALVLLIRNSAAMGVGVGGGL